ncbi:uncharacterized protein LOC142605858 [Castanea sativa]|uniref:uncharacterized protein LOC142605858 n=1 Tax=Castanea sativa TaxID=21020 RepID=UPI003F649277
MELYNIEHYKSLPFRPQTNGAMEAANKDIKNILAKMDYRASIGASTRATFHSLVYGSKTVLPIEVEIQSLRMLVETKVLEEDWMKERYKQLALVDEKRARAHYHAQRYQKRITKAFNKKVKLRNLKEGDLVLKLLRDETVDPRGKMKPRWSGPFIIKKIMSGCATRITNLDGEEMFHPIDMDRLQRYNI